MFLTKKGAVSQNHFIYLYVKSIYNMKHTKYIIYLFLFLLYGCSLEKDEQLLLSSNNGSFSTLGTVVDTERITIDSDTYGTLLPINTSIFTDNKVNILGQRVLLEILFLNENKQNNNVQAKDVKIISLYKVLTKDADIITSEETAESVNDIFGTAPIFITSSTISKEHLNIQYEIGGNNSNISHRISLLVPQNAHLDENGLLPVELRHNAGADLQINSYWGVDSFTLSSIPQYQDSAFKGFRILYKNKEGDDIHTVTLHK